MIIGVLKENLPETRVSLLAESVAVLVKKRTNRLGGDRCGAYRILQ